MATLLNPAINLHVALPVEKKPTIQKNTLATVKGTVQTVIVVLILLTANTVLNTGRYSLLLHQEYTHTTMRALQLNIQSLNTSGTYLAHFVDTKSILLAAISETNNKQDFLKFKDWKTEFKNRLDGTAHGGVALLAHPTVKMVRRRDYDVFDLEVVWAQIEINKVATNVVSVYIPPTNTTDHLLSFIANIDYVKSVSKLPILILGDLNARSYSWELFHTSSSRIDRSRYISFLRGEIIEQASIALNMDIHNTGSPTRFMSSFYSAPDLTMSIGNVPPFHWLPQKHDPTFSDHYPIILDFRTSQTTTKKVWNLNKVDWNIWSETLGPKLSTWVENTPLYTHPDLAVKQYNDIVLKNASDHIPLKTITRFSKPFFSEAVRTKLKACKDDAKVYKRLRAPHIYRRLQNSITEFLAELDRAKVLWWNELCDNLKHAGTNMWTIVNKVLKGGKAAPVQPLRDKDGEYIFDDSEISKIMTATHVTRENMSTDKFDDKWKQEVDTYVQNNILIEQTRMEKGEDTEVYNRDIQLHETVGALKLSNSDGAPGPDTIHPKFIQKSNSPEAVNHLSRIAWHNASFPDQWKMDNRIYHNKPFKEDYHISKAYRPISLTDFCGKVHERILARRLVAFLRSIGFFDGSQFAYLKGLDTTQCLLALTLQI